MHQAQQILHDIFGYTGFRLNQAEVIDTLLQGGDSLTLMPTGGGKSLCYQIPALIRTGAGVVVSPLIALMQDQVDALKQLGIRAAFLNSSLAPGAQQAVEQQLLGGALDLIYLAPERLLTERMLDLLERTEIALFAIDEAHCVSQWGHDFRKEYQRLTILHERFPATPRIALTATADERTRQEIIQQLNLQQAAIFINSFDRPNIRYTLAEGQNAREQLWRFLEREHPDHAGIVYCLSRRKVEDVAEWLTARGRIALPYHAGLPDHMRSEHQARFLREEGVIIVATIAFGMGIDKPDVRFVAHLNLPKSVEAYYQETGRAGRDGEPADAWMAYGLQDVITLRQFVHDADAEEFYKRVATQKLEAMLGLCELTGCRRQALLAYFGETLSQPCGNCDNCLDPPEGWNATEPARKALSCVYRTGQRFGVNYAVDVLLGKADPRIQRNQHDQLSTYGIGSELKAVEWRSLFRQLIAGGYLTTDQEGYGTLRLTQKCRPLLKGEKQLNLRRQQKKGKEQKKEQKKVQQEVSELRPMDQPLFAALRSLRLEIAREQGVAPFIIFHDSTLKLMARKRPRTHEQMRAISGVGEQKLQAYSERFIGLIGEYPLPALLQNNLSDTINDTLLLYQQGLDAEAIADKRQLKISTIYSHFAAAVEADLLDVRKLLPLDDAQYQEIKTAMAVVKTCEEMALKPLYEALEEAYDYGILKCVTAAECG